MRFREIEKKFEVLECPSHADLVQQLRRMFLHTDFKTGVGTDYFWTVEDNPETFVRVRDCSDGHSELTVKREDRGNVIDRREVNIPLPDWKTGYEFTKTLFGEPDGHITKVYSVIILLTDVILSTYRICGDDRIFFEVEGARLDLIEAVVEDAGKELILKPVHKSLYSIFIKGEKQ